MFDEDLLIGFVDEAKEHLTTIEPDLLAIESNPTNMDIVNRLFRSVHSIKGGAGFFGLEQLGTLSHAMENLMSKARTSEMILGKKHIDALLKGLDKLNHMIDDVANSNTSDIAEELKLFDSLEAVTKTETDSESVDIPDTELQIQNQNFTVDKSEIEAVSKSGMDIYSISLFLVKDIAVKNKTPIQLIAELEEFGKFIDGHLETSTITTLESCLDEDLCFEFIFATIMDASLIAAVLEIDPKNIVPFDIESYTAVKQEESILENKETESEPITNLPVSAAELSVLSTVKAEKTTTTPVAKKIQVEESIRVSLKKLNKLINMAGELV